MKKEYTELTDEERDLIDELQYVEYCLQKTGRKEHWPAYRKRREELENELKERGIL